MSALLPLLSALARIAGALTIGATLVTQAPAATELELRDQYGVVHTVAAHRGEPAVLIVVTARRLRTVRPWERALQERYDDLRTVLVADVPTEPPPDYERVAQKLVRRVPEGVSVLIDIDGAWARELKLDTSRPNLLLLSRRGAVVGSVAGRFEPELGAELFEMIDREREIP